MPQWIDSAPVTPDIVARGVPTMSPGGGKEIHYDSSALRNQFDASGAPQMDVTNPAYAPEIVTGPTPTPQQLAENLPPDVLKAMANGGTPSPESIRAMMAARPPFPVLDHRNEWGPPIATSQQALAAVELTIPVGNGVTARVTFTSQPARIHWRKLIRHLEIEAEDADETPISNSPDLVALADAALARSEAATAGHQETPPRTPRKRRTPKVASNPETPSE